MYEKFTERARRVMQLAKKDAIQHDHDAIHIDNLLAGLIEEGSGIAATVLKELDVTLAKLRIASPLKNSSKLSSENTNLNHLTAVAIAYADATRTDLQHSYIGTEHLLLGLLQVVDNFPSASVLSQLLGHRKTDDVRAAVRRFLDLMKNPANPAATPEETKAPDTFQWPTFKYAIGQMVELRASGHRAVVGAHEVTRYEDGFSCMYHVTWIGNTGSLEGAKMTAIHLTECHDDQ